MGERIGRPLTEEVGKPRVLPEAQPLPLPEKVPAPEKKELVKVLPDGTEAIAKAAKFLGVSETRVREILDNIVSRISDSFPWDKWVNRGGLGKAPYGTSAS